MAYVQEYWSICYCNDMSKCIAFTEQLCKWLDDNKIEYKCHKGYRTFTIGRITIHSFDYDHDAPRRIWCDYLIGGCEWTEDYLRKKNRNLKKMETWGELLRFIIEKM